MAPAVLRVNFEDGPCWLPAWWRKASAAGLVGVTVLTVLLTDRERIVQYQGAVAYETLACALLLALVVLPAT